MNNLMPLAARIAALDKNPRRRRYGGELRHAIAVAAWRALRSGMSRSGVARSLGVSSAALDAMMAEVPPRVAKGVVQVAWVAVVEVNSDATSFSAGAEGIGARDAACSWKGPS